MTTVVNTSTSFHLRVSKIRWAKNNIFTKENRIKPKWPTSFLKVFDKLVPRLSIYRANMYAKMNYEDKFHKVEDILNNWQNKRLTLPGKITIIKTLAASQLVYIMSSLRTCFKSLKEINDLLLKFLWDGKRDKIKRSEMIADSGDGGQKMLDIMAFNKSLKIAWYVYFQ